MQLHNKTTQEKIIHTLLGTFLCLVLVYVLVLISLIFTVIERKQNLIAIKEISSELSQLEADYANTVSSITDNELRHHDFTRIEDTTFVVRKDPIASYTVLYAR